VYETFARMVAARARNLCVVGGDATVVLPKHVRAASVAGVFVNHPEPPQQRGGSEGASSSTSQSRHLLTPQFFGMIHRVLQPDGTVTVVTDNQWYARLLLRSLSLIAHGDNEHGESDGSVLFESVSLTTAEGGGGGGGGAGGGAGDAVEAAQRSVCETGARGVTMFVGAPGKACGHVADASSYFDRLKAADEIVDRYFFILKKVDAAADVDVDAVCAAAAQELADAARAASERRANGDWDDDDKSGNNGGGGGGGGANKKLYAAPARASTYVKPASYKLPEKQVSYLTGGVDFSVKKKSIKL
jgi:hypothetical protein